MLAISSNLSQSMLIIKPQNKCGVYSVSSIQKVVQLKVYTPTFFNFAEVFNAGNPKGNISSAAAVGDTGKVMNAITVLHGLCGVLIQSSSQSQVLKSSDLAKMYYTLNNEVMWFWPLVMLQIIRQARNTMRGSGPDSMESLDQTTL